VAYDWIIDALATTWRQIDLAVAQRSERDFDALTSCPGWSVRDVVNHVTGTELFLRGAPIPDVTGAWPSYVVNSLGEMNEAFVASRRHLGREEVLRDFRAATASSVRHLRTLSPDQWRDEVWTPDGPRARSHAQETRVLDSWIHLHDIREALLEPEDDHGIGEEIVVNRFESALPYVWARRVGAPEGSLLRVNLVGHAGRSIQIEVQAGRGTAMPVSAREPDVEVTTAVGLFWRRMAGRINAEAFLRASATDIRGDRGWAQRLAQGMTVVP